MPQVGETRSAHGETRTWDGSRWQDATDPRGFQMFNLPPKDPSPKPDDGGGVELLKQFLTTAGTVGGGAALGWPGAVLGGAGGRMLGHGIENLHSSATRIPNDNDFISEGAIGAGEGALQEVAPIVGGKVMQGAGKVAEMLPRRADWMLWPAAARAIGEPLDEAGAAIGSKSLSGHVRSALDWLTAKEPIPISHTDAMAGQADRYAAQKGAQTAQDDALASQWKANRPSYASNPAIREAGAGMPSVNPADDLYGNYQSYGPDRQPPVTPKPSASLNALLREPAVSASERGVPADRRFVLTPEELRARDIQNRLNAELAKLGGMQSAAKAYKP